MTKNWIQPDGALNVIGRKRVDWSMFNDGTTIPIDFHERFYEANSGERLSRGEQRNVQLLVEDTTFSAVLRMVDHSGGRKSDCLQLRYDGKDGLPDFLRTRLPLTYGHSLPNIHAPDEFAAYLDFVATGTPYVYLVNILQPPSSLGGNESLLSGLDEYAVETAIDTARNDQDFIMKLSSLAGNASVETKEAIVNIRKLRRRVVTDLKKFYGGQCQLCGWTSITDYGVDVSQGHHIIGFLVSKDNTPSNIAILCPSCHCLVHALKATLAPEKHSFVGTNDHTMPLMIDHHLLL